MAVLQPLIDLAQLCQLHGVTHAVISPGSRSAALTLAFARNPSIDCRVVMDERAAGFIAMGMAQQSKKTVALICTSGSAAYNFAPAIAEAFFQQIPLLVLTADRPKEWIHQNDGQTIFQTEIYGRHVKGFWELPSDYSHPDATWYINRSVNEALLSAQSFPKGPVHINIPIREPFYPQKEEKLLPSKEIRIIHRFDTKSTLDQKDWEKILKGWEGSNKILIAVGQLDRSEFLNKLLVEISEKYHVPVLGDVTSNIENNEVFINRQDLFLNEKVNNNLRPNLLITLGKSFISKKFKGFIRDNSPKYHWHISEETHVIDTFQTLTKQVNVSPEYFFNELLQTITTVHRGKAHKLEKHNSYLTDWLREQSASKKLLADYLSNLTSLNDITAINFVIKNLPEGSQLQLANSMTVRYANILSADREGVVVFCNRGTSGIDGCVSTAIGAALITANPVFLIVGDVAFFYDRNGLMMEHLPPNLKIVLLNNEGGTIFRMIDGPASQPELQKYFETRHHFNSSRTAEDSGIDYFLVQSWAQGSLDSLQTVWGEFVKTKNTAILELQTNPELNASVYQGLKDYVRKS